MSDYFFEELKAYAELLGIDRPEIVKCLENARRNPDTAPAYKKHFMRELRRRGLTLSELPAFGVGPSSASDGVSPGDVLLGERKVSRLALNPGSFDEHALIVGHSGSGKSFLIRHLIPQFAARGIPSWIFDPENEYKVLLRRTDPASFLVLSPASDRDNFLQPPAGVPPQEWLGRLKNLCREVFYFRDGSINLLDGIIRGLYANRGVLDGGSDYPSIADLVATLDRMEFKPGTRFSGYHESLVNRFRSLAANLDKALSCRRGFDLAALANRTVVFRLAGMSDDIRNFYVCLKLLRLSSYMERSLAPGLRMLVVIEEAHKLFNERISSRYDLGEGMIFGSARTFRKRGIGFVYSDQVPSALPDPLLANVNARFVMRLVNGKCGWRMAQAMNLTREQADFIPLIPKRRCIFQSADYPEPVLFEVPLLTFDCVSDEEAERHSQSMISSLDWEPLVDETPAAGECGKPLPGEKRRSSGAKPNKAWQEICRALAESGFLSLSELYARLGNVTPWLARKIMNEMERQALVELCPLSLGTRGNPKTFAVLTEKGAQFAGLDFEKIRLAGRGSTEHVILQNLLAESLRSAGKTVAIEHEANGKAVDVAEIREDGACAYEIELEPAHPHVVENVLRDIEAGFDEIIVVTKNQTGQNEAKDKIYKAVPWEKLGRVKFKLFREFS